MSDQPVPSPPKRVSQHQVACPGCGERTVFSPVNPFRPFCSARCQGMDFGAWAEEHYRVSAQPPADYVVD